MVLMLFGTNQTLKDKAVWWLSSSPDFARKIVEVVHRPVGFLDVIFNGSKALFWTRFATLVRNAEKSTDLTIFDYSLLDYLREAENLKVNTPAFQKSILQKIKPNHHIFLVDDTAQHNTLKEWLLSLGVPFTDITEAVKSGS